MKTPQVIQTFLTVSSVYDYVNARVVNSRLIYVFLSSVPDSDATVSSENSEGEAPRERERERDVTKK